MIECKNLTVSYGKKIILRSLSFTADPGGITVILGRNGSGKSTLLRALSGIIPFEGKVSAGGTDIRDLRPAARARLISLMPQILKSPEITVRELVSFGRHPYAGFGGILSPADREKVEAVLAQTGILPLADCLLGKISGGERQKAYFAMLLAQNTPILLLDEPGAHLDTEYMKNLCRFLLGEKKAGKTILAVLHDINRAMEIADRILVLREGELCFSGSPLSFAESTLPETLFGLERFSATGAAGNITFFG